LCWDSKEVMHLLFAFVPGHRHGEGHFDVRM
jgi:hypothetical protein